MLKRSLYGEHEFVHVESINSIVANKIAESDLVIFIAQCVGIQVLAEISFAKKELKAKQIILIGDYHSLDVKLSAYEVGCNYCISKEADIREILFVISANTRTKIRDVKENKTEFKKVIEQLTNADKPY